jgi:FixJ family two-component response regulator
MNPQEAHAFVVDDDPAVAAAIGRALETAGMKVSVFFSAHDCLAALPRQACDLILTDLCMEGMDGLSLLREIRHRFPWLQVIIVSAYGDIPLAVAALRAGAVTFLEKPLDRQELLTAVEMALGADAQSVSFPREPLSSVEMQVLRLFLNGLTSRESGVALNRSTRTIEAHRHNLMRKFGVRNAVLLAQKASALWRDDQPIPRT